MLGFRLVNRGCQLLPSPSAWPHSLSLIVACLEVGRQGSASSVTRTMFYQSYPLIPGKRSDILKFQERQKNQPSPACLLACPVHCVVAAEVDTLLRALLFTLVPIFYVAWQCRASIVRLGLHMGSRKTKCFLRQCRSKRAQA